MFLMMLPEVVLLGGAVMEGTALGVVLCLRYIITVGLCSHDNRDVVKNDIYIYIYILHRISDNALCCTHYISNIIIQSRYTAVIVYCSDSARCMQHSCEQC